MGARGFREASGRRGRFCGALLAAALVLGIRVTAQRPVESPGPVPVRPLDACAAQAVADAWARAPSVRELVGRLAQTDVVAYVRCAWLRTEERHGVLAWVGRTETQRFVQLALSHRVSPQQRVEMLGHELQHALEVGAAVWVDGEAALPVLFRRIGRQTSVDGTFETVAASEAEIQVRREVAGSGWPIVVGGVRVAADRAPGRKRQP